MNASSSEPWQYPWASTTSCKFLAARLYSYLPVWRCFAKSHDSAGYFGEFFLSRIRLDHCFDRHPETIFKSFESLVNMSCCLRLDPYTAILFYCWFSYPSESALDLSYHSQNSLLLFLWMVGAFQLIFYYFLLLLTTPSLVYLVIEAELVRV